jgi:hypothetical protein
VATADYRSHAVGKASLPGHNRRRFRRPVTYDRVAALEGGHECQGLGWRCEWLAGCRSIRQCGWHGDELTIIERLTVDKHGNRGAVHLAVLRCDDCLIECAPSRATTEGKG